MNKWIYHFGSGVEQNNAPSSSLLGGKGSCLAEMSGLGLPIPQGFTITTELCSYYYGKDSSLGIPIGTGLPRELPTNIIEDIIQAVKKLECQTGKEFGGANNPLLVSVRSGAKVSMPGMMDTILNLGMNDQVAEALAKVTNNKRFALDSYRRFLEMYSSIVLEISSYLFEDSFESHKARDGVINDNEIEVSTLELIIKDYKKIILARTGQEFQANPYEQLKAAIEAVLKSWMSPRAIVYRKINNISEDYGTAVNIQSMVFGNMGHSSATGVVFTRCPSTGDNKIFGEFLIDAQGEDVVAGVRTPLPIISSNKDELTLQKAMPQIFEELASICKKLELHYRDIQDIEFTVENGKLYILQTRSAKRTTAAAVKIAVNMADEGVITKQEAIMRIDPESLNHLLHTAIDYTKAQKEIAKGLPASPGAATGVAVFSSYDVESVSHHHKVILVRNDTSPEDIKGMHLSSGILTARGGMTSHAAVVARGMGRSCVCGVNGIVVNERERTLTIGDIVIRQGDEITIDGSSGKIFLGRVPLIQPTFSNEFKTLLTWADQERRMKVRANAETVVDVSAALKFGAEGIGLCRTEHMFFDKDKIPLVREMIIAPDLERRQAAIEKLLPLQVHDFKEIFRIMEGAPINIRLLDPPLHEFLPSGDDEKKLLSESFNLPLSIIEQRLYELHEVNPMLGHRGCRLGISYPEIYIMQLNAIFTAISELKVEENITTNLELMIPLVSNINELKELKEYIYKELNSRHDSLGIKINISLGTMIELPRSALIAGSLAKEVDYFSFGTNDLTQTTYGISRDDVASFLPGYLDKKIFECDPFVQIDEEGVGELISIAIERGKKANPNVKLGVCGEHAANPESIKFFHKIGIDYISCSPYRIPLARLVAAQATIGNRP